MYSRYFSWVNFTRPDGDEWKISDHKIVLSDVKFDETPFSDGHSAGRSAFQSAWDKNTCRGDAHNSVVRE